MIVKSVSECLAAITLEESAFDTIFDEEDEF